MNRVWSGAPDKRLLVVLAIMVIGLCLAAGFVLVPTQHRGAAQTTESPAAAGREAQPNILFILTDDMRHDDLRHMPKTRSLLVERGMKFERAYVTDSVCCPSRATILRGQYAHNHRVLTNKPPLGSSIKFRKSGRDRSTVAVWLDRAGYETALFGNYLKSYDGTYVPPGWDEWYGWVGQSYVSRNGSVGKISGELNARIFEEAGDFVSQPREKPFFAYVATKIPHPPAKPPAAYEGLYPNLKTPRDRAFNERVIRDKPSWINNKKLLDKEQARRIDKLYRNRARSLTYLDDMVERIANTLKAAGQLDNTYIVFTSDNGFHMGEHRLSPMKQTAYEEDIRVPLIVRGPGVPEGTTQRRFALNNDLAPTFAEWAGTEVPSFVDGRSLVPLLSGERPDEWRTAFLVEKWGDQIMSADYKGVRTRNNKYVEYSNGERELYRLSRDPQELRNVYDKAGSQTVEKLKSRLNELKDCKGTECRRTENGSSPPR